MAINLDASPEAKLAARLQIVNTHEKRVCLPLLFLARVTHPAESLLDYLESLR